MNYEQKYLKYKAKYLKNKQEGGENELEIYFINNADKAEIEKYGNINIIRPGKRVIAQKTKAEKQQADINYLKNSFPYIIEKTSILHIPAKASEKIPAKPITIKEKFNYTIKSHLDTVLKIMNSSIPNSPTNKNKLLLIKQGIFIGIYDITNDNLTPLPVSYYNDTV